MGTLVLWRGLARDYVWTIESAPGVPADLSPYNACKIGIDDKEGAVDKIVIDCAIKQTGAGTDEDPFVRKGEIEFSLVRADSVSWKGNVRIRHQAVVRSIANGEWYPCGGPDPCVVHDSTFDTLP